MNSLPEKNRDLHQLAGWLKTSQRTVILTGAGMSTESNIPDFRSSSGWWKKIDPRTVATTEAINSNYDLFHDFYSSRIQGRDDIQPHDGHRILASWEKLGLVHLIGTQNVDGLHGAAGSRNIRELHGSIATVRCHNCDRKAAPSSFLQKQACKTCGGKLRPDVVLFGEMLPQDEWSETLAAIEQADLVIVIGTSLEVYPANQLPSMTSGRTVYINAEIDYMPFQFDLVIEGKARKTLSDVNDLIK